MQFRDPLSGRIVEEVDEIDAIYGLIKSSPEFKRFYNEERSAKLGEIKWLLDCHLGEEFEMKSRTDVVNGLNYHFIYIKNCPIQWELACVTAHEIMHLLLAECGESLEIFYPVGSPYKILAEKMKTCLRQK